MNDWKNYINENGDFELPNFLYKTITDLMKQTLDMGTLLSSDQAKLRAYKEQTKKSFKSRWYDIAKALEFFNIIDPCICATDDKEVYCEICKGARYIISSTLTADEMREVGLFTNAITNVEVVDKLQKSLNQILMDFQ
jgi:predicted Fe-S protein YdhL (DUF1289 family)